MNELSLEARALIARVGLADGPGAERRNRVKRRLVAALVSTGAGIGGVTSAAAASAHAGAAGVALGTTTAKGALTLSSVAVWLAAGAGLGTLVSAPALVLRVKAAEERPVAVAPAVLAPSAFGPAAFAPSTVSPSPVAEPAAPAPASTATPAAQGPQPQLGPNERELPAAPLAAAPAPASPLAEETRLVESAQRELAAQRARAALTLLEEHEQRFPHGVLAEERAAARVLSLCALGRVDEAKRAAAAFQAASPRSPLIPRLRNSCALLDSTEPTYNR